MLIPVVGELIAIDATLNAVTFGTHTDSFNNLDITAGQDTDITMKRQYALVGYG